MGGTPCPEAEGGVWSLVGGLRPHELGVRTPCSVTRERHVTPGARVPAPVSVAVEGRPELAEAAVRPEAGAVSRALPAAGTERLSMQEAQAPGLHSGEGAFLQEGAFAPVPAPALRILLEALASLGSRWVVSPRELALLL